MDLEVPNSSEKIFWILKSTKYSYSEKIVFVTKVWNSTDIIFINKNIFISDWVCSTLIKSCGFSRISFGETPFLNLDYWSLLEDILEIKKDSSKCLESNIDNLIRDQDELSKLLNKLPLVNVFTRVLEFFIDFSKGETDYDTLKLLELVNRNFRQLIEESKFFKPSIDQITTLTLNACNLLAYNILIGKLLGPILNSRYFLIHLNEKNQYTIIQNIIEQSLQQINDVLRYGLFKQDHIMEYVPGTNESNTNQDKKVIGKNSTNYHKQLFEKLREIMNTKNSSFFSGGSDGQLLIVIETLPDLYSFFIEELRNHLNSLSSLKNIKEIINNQRLLEFNFLLEFWEIVNDIITNSNSQQQNPVHFKVSLEIQSILLSKLLNFNVYQPKKI
ncbi:13333_t:CDS:2 [Entrophospora sp. SA101]|nr:7320_t:CDS:2 [Entrophospora sp. SA101]CAJ0828607.1 13333_t:CDS:2 [Entrophospora sp. SA101]CAJ0907641.1 19054_t:CDS:2 [Entrophospora sp. SA101]